MPELIVFSYQNVDSLMFHRIGGDGIIIGEPLPLPARMARVKRFSVIGCVQTFGYVQEQERKVFVFGGVIRANFVYRTPYGFVRPNRFPLSAFCVNPYGLPTFEFGDTPMFFPMFRPNLMSYGSLVILTPRYGRRENLNVLGKTFHTLSQQWELIPNPFQFEQHRISLVVLVHDSGQNPFVLFWFSNSDFGFYSIWQKRFVQLQQTTFNLDALAHVPNWERRRNLGGVEVVYSFRQGILVVVDLARPHISIIDMCATLGYYYQAGGVEARLLAADGQLHLVWSPEHLQPDLGCLIVWSSFQVERGELEFSVVGFVQVEFVVDDPARLTAVEFAVL